MEPTRRLLDAFRRFLDLFPHGKDRELVILKGHLLIEEQIRLIVDQRAHNLDALKEAQLTCGQAICLAQALLPPGELYAFVPPLKKLNAIRNKIAHRAEHAGLDDQIEDFIKSVPVDWEAPDRSQTFELAIWSLFVHVSAFVEGKIDPDMKLLVPVVHP